MHESAFLISVQKAGNKIVAEYPASDLHQATRKVRDLFTEFAGEADRVAIFRNAIKSWELVLCWRYCLESDSWLSCDPESDLTDSGKTD
jgi:hypothetical protein